MAEDEADVIARARRGDRRAFTELVRTYQRRVYATALHITGNHGDADDVTQDTFVRAYRGLSSFDGRSDLFTWLYRVTVNTALNLLRSGRRVQSIAAAGAVEVAAGGGRPERLGEAPTTPAQNLQLDDRLRRVLDEVCALSPTLRVTLVLATVEQLPYRKIAEILEIPEGTVAWRVNEARKKLRERLELDDSDDDVGQ
jgi:RNA polymerase sigma-70 factor, ECF subfamily